MFPVPPTYESKESYGMQGWFRRIFQQFKQLTAIVNVTTTYTVADNVFYVRADATAGAFTVTLPAASSNEGRMLAVCKIDAGGNAVTVAASGSDTIQGSATISLAAQWNKALIISNGNNGWERLI